MHLEPEGLQAAAFVCCIFSSASRQCRIIGLCEIFSGSCLRRGRVVASRIDDRTDAKSEDLRCLLSTIVAARDSSTEFCSRALAAGVLARGWSAAPSLRCVLSVAAALTLRLFPKTLSRGSHYRLNALSGLKQQRHRRLRILFIGLGAAVSGVWGCGTYVRRRPS